MSSSPSQSSPPTSQASSESERIPARMQRQGFRATMRTAFAQSPELEALQKAEFKEKPWPFSMFEGLSTDKAKVTTFLGCLSSSIVLAVRLYLDVEPVAYLIHSIIVFFDMVLIHMFTHSVWLSVSGEILTYAFFLSFHFTKEPMWELLETTLLAVISSMYMISSRKAVMEERDLLTNDIDSLRARGALLLRNIHQVHEALRIHESTNPGSMRDSVMVQVKNEKDKLKKISEQGSLLGPVIKEDDDVNHEDETDVESSVALDSELTRELLKQGECHCTKKTFNKRLNKWLAPFQTDECKKKKKIMKQKMKNYQEIAFEYFLDGAAGVMYSSFLGLIVDAALSYGNSKY